MSVPLIRTAAAAAALLLAGCSGREPAGEADGVAGNAVAPPPPAAPAAETPAPVSPPASPPPAKAPQTRTAPWSATGYAFNGTEPFWGGSLTGTTIRYMTPEDQFGDVIETSAIFSAERETYTGRHAGHPFVLTLARGACSDGMSDRTYAFSATLQVGGEARRGCADPQ